MSPAKSKVTNTRAAAAIQTPNEIGTNTSQQSEFWFQASGRTNRGRSEVYHSPQPSIEVNERSTPFIPPRGFTSWTRTTFTFTSIFAQGKHMNVVQDNRQCNNESKWGQPECRPTKLPFKPTCRLKDREYKNIA